MTKKTIKVKSCVSCKSHKIIADPDPSDWFCDDDVALVCTLVKNRNRKSKSRYLADKNEFKSVMVSMRPYMVEKETPIPDWCPKRKAGTNGRKGSKNTSISR